MGGGTCDGERHSSVAVHWSLSMSCMLIKKCFFFLAATITLFTFWF